MGEIKIDIGQVHSILCSMKMTENELNSVKVNLLKIENQNVMVNNSFRSLNNAIIDLENVNQTIHKLRQTAEKAIESYLEVDKWLLKELPAYVFTTRNWAETGYWDPGNSSTQNFLDFLSGRVKYTDVKSFKTLEKGTGEPTQFEHIFYQKNEETESISWTSYHDKNGLTPKKMKEFLKKTKESSSIDKNGNLIDSKKVSEKEKDATVLELKRENNKEFDIYRISDSTDSEIMSADYSISIGKAECYSELKAGLYAYDKNGNEILAPAVSAAVGASVSIFEADADFQLGLGENQDMLGLYGDVEVSALKASGEAKAELSIIGSDGLFNPEVDLSTSAEAILGEVKGDVGVSVLGTDIGVTAGVSFGIGVHADVGYSDGVFKFDLGAAVGVGIDFGIELDVKGTVDAVVGIVEGIFSWF